MRRHFVYQNNSLGMGKCQPLIACRPPTSHTEHPHSASPSSPPPTCLPCRWLLLSPGSGEWRWTPTRIASVAAAASATMSTISRSPARGCSTTGWWVGGRGGMCMEWLGRIGRNVHRFTHVGIRGSHGRECHLALAPSRTALTFSPPPLCAQAPVHAGAGSVTHRRRLFPCRR